MVVTSSGLAGVEVVEGLEAVRLWVLVVEVERSMIPVLFVLHGP